MSTVAIPSKSAVSAMNRADLDALATSLGLDPADYATRTDEITAIEEVRSMSSTETPPNGTDAATEGTESEDPGFGLASELGAEAVLAQYMEERESDTDDEGNETFETVDEWRARTGYDVQVERTSRELDDEQAALDARKAEIEDQKARIVERTGG